MSALDVKICNRMSSFLNEVHAELREIYSLLTRCFVRGSIDHHVGSTAEIVARIGMQSLALKIKLPPCPERVQRGLPNWFVYATLEFGSAGIVRRIVWVSLDSFLRSRVSRTRADPRASNCSIITVLCLGSVVPESCLGTRHPALNPKQETGRRQTPAEIERGMLLLPFSHHLPRRCS